MQQQLQRCLRCPLLLSNFHLLYNEVDHKLIHGRFHLQHLSETTQGMTMDYFVVGSANFVEDSQAHKDAVPAGSSKFYYASDGGIGVVAFNKTQMSMTFISGGNKELYQHVMKPRRGQ